MRKFAVFDIDGTVFRSSLYIEIVYELARRGIIDLPKEEHHQAYVSWAKRKHDGYETYRNKLVEILESQITGMNVDDFDKAAEAVLKHHAERVYVYTRDLISKLKKEGYLLIALSGSQLQLVERFAGFWGFDDFIGQSYHQENGKFTGAITKTHTGKDILLQPLIEKHDLDIDNSIAVGDTEGDISILELVNRPIAFNPNRKLYKHAVKAGWEIIVERKDMIYKFGPGPERNYELVDTE